MTNGEHRWALALTALNLLNADATLKGLLVKSSYGPVQQAFADCIAARFPTTHIPVSVSPERLSGGLDISKTLATGKPVHQSGLLETKQGALVINGAERLDTMTCSTLSAHLDNPASPPTVLVVMDESTGDEPGVADSTIAERLAMMIELPVLPLATLQALISDMPAPDHQLAKHCSINARQVQLPDELLQELTSLAQRLGVDSLRALLFAARVARVHAAMHSRDKVTMEDAGIAAQLVLSPRALGLDPLPQDEEQQQQEEQDQEQPPEEQCPEPPDVQNASEPDQQETDSPQDSSKDIGEQLLDAASATLPEHVIANLVRGQKNNQSSGRDTSATGTGTSGRPTGVRRPRGGLSGHRLNIIETLKAAAPKQRLRGNEIGASQTRLQVRVEDFRITRFKQPTRTTTVFVVDASGSAALHRLAEAKGAVELLLAECYVRRDRVAMISFRGTSAQLELPPTRSLVRAKRELAGLPGGGGTPLASGLDLAAQVVQQLKQAGETAVVIIMTDGKANIARDGEASRSRAVQDAHQAARQLAQSEARCLFVDTAPRASAQARELATIMQARYLVLPAFNPQALPELISA